MKELAASNVQMNATIQQNQADTKGAIAEINKQLSQLATTVSELKKETDRLPTQTIQNPRGNVSAVTLRSGKQLVVESEEQREEEGSMMPEENQTGPGALGIDEPERVCSSEKNREHPGRALGADGPELGCGIASKEYARQQPGQSDASGMLNSRGSAPKRATAPEERPTSLVPAPGNQESSPVHAPEPANSKLGVSLPFPVPARAPKRYVMDKDVWEIFSKVEINIPLLDAIKQIPRYAKFLKELCTNRRRGTCVDQELMSRNVSAVIQRTVPPKCGDPGTYTIPCTIGNIRIENCMLDLGASINVLPYSIYSCLWIGPLEPAGLTIQLADRSCKQPEGKIEDVLIQVGELVFPADFYVLKMENCGPNDHAPILLGRPFLKTSKMKIDCGSGMLSMEVEGEVFSFDIFQAMKHPLEFEMVHALDTLDDIIREAQPERESDPLELVLDRALYSAESTYELAGGIEGALYHLEIARPLTPRYEVNEIRLFKSNTCLPSIVQAPKVELKPLPEHLKYAFLGDNGTLPVIIKNGLEANQERRLIEVLGRYKLAIGWTLRDLRGISPAVCMHRILLEDGARPSREPQ
ncbi:unnamed protein product [Rhodiola kirilowii]